MRKFLWCIVTLLAILSSCNDDVAVEQNGLLKTRSAIGNSLAVNSSFIKLADDTTRFEAGFLEITAPTPEVSIKWNVLPEFNIDTTATTIQVRDGKISLPIKWNNCFRTHHHAPEGLVFEGGVIVQAGNQAKYVRLILSERIDSVKLSANPVIMDSPEAPYPTPRMILFNPARVRMQTLGTTGVFVTVNGNRTTINYNELGVGTNVDQENVNPNGPANNLMNSDGVLFFKWTAAGPPLFSFIRGIDFIQDIDGISSLVARLYVEYTALNGSVFTLRSILPDNIGFISGKDGFVTVIAETDSEWSISSGFNKAELDIEDSEISPVKNRALVMQIKDNDGPTKRVIPIVSKSRGIEQNTTDLIQQGGDPNLFLQYESNTIATPVPKVGGTYTITFKGDYDGPLLVRPVIAGVPGIPGAATNSKTAIVTVPENPTTENRNITFEFCVDGENWFGRRWAAVSPETDRIQLGENGGEETPVLEYVNSNLPALPGNIPQIGELYTFNFKGTYEGRLRVRASVNGTWYTGDMSSALNASVAIPANNTANVLPVKFQYRAFDAVPSVWTYLPDDTKRNQDALTNTGTLIPGDLTPADYIDEWAGPASCTFTGTYTGKMYMQAVVDGVVIAGPVEGRVGEVITLTIPQLIGSNRTITFQYRKEGEEWQTFTTREQKNGTITLFGSSPAGDFVAGGEPYRITFAGTYSKKITVVAEIEDGGGLGGKVTLVEETAYISPKHEFVLMIPENPSNKPRGIGISFIREDLPNKKFLIVVKAQFGKK